MKTKICEVCGEMKPLDDFSKSYSNRCKKCVAEQTRIKRAQARQTSSDKQYFEMNADIEELKQNMMMMLLDTDKDFAKNIVCASREVADYMIAKDDEDELNPKQRNNYAIFFCIGAAWMMTQNKQQI